MAVQKAHIGGLILNIATTVLAFISLLIFISNTGSNYYSDSNPAVLVSTIIALVASIVVIVLSRGSYSVVKRRISDVLRIAVPVLIIFAGIKFIGMRLESFGYIFGSNLEMGNEEAFSAGTQAIRGIILFMLTWLVSLVACFISPKKPTA